jgi:hypothetical protein
MFRTAAEPPTCSQKLTFRPSDDGHGSRACIHELSRIVLAETIQPGDKVIVEAEEGQLRFDLNEASAAEREEAEAKAKEPAAPRA